MSLDIDLGSGAHLIFTTPILMHRHQGPAVNEALAAAILQREADSAGRRVSNVGGWQSRADVLDWDLEAVATLRDRVRVAVEQMTRLPVRGEPPVDFSAYAWANVNRAGDYNSIHSHDSDHWACVYYVRVDESTDSGERPLEGRLELRDPRAVASADKYPGFTFGQGLVIKPEPGLLLLFPAWLEHLVHPFQGEGLRISIAANVTLKGATTRVDAPA